MLSAMARILPTCLSINGEPFLAFALWRSGHTEIAMWQCQQKKDTSFLPKFNVSLNFKTAFENLCVQVAQCLY